MSSIQHLSVIVTGWNKEDIEKARKVAINIFTKNMVTSITKSLINQYESFMVCSSGSKEGWDEDIQHQNDITKFIMFLDTMKCGEERHDSSLQYVVVSYGDRGSKIEDTNQIDKSVKAKDLKGLENPYFRRRLKIRREILENGKISN